MFKKNNPTIALDILHIKEKEICPAYISKINSSCVKQTILFNSNHKRIKRRMTLSCSKKNYQRYYEE